jgi:hypothetical protein
VALGVKRDSLPRGGAAVARHAAVRPGGAARPGVEPLGRDPRRAGHAGAAARGGRRVGGPGRQPSPARHSAPAQLPARQDGRRAGTSTPSDSFRSRAQYSTCARSSYASCAAAAGRGGSGRQAARSRASSAASPADSGAQAAGGAPAARASGRSKKFSNTCAAATSSLDW